MRSGNVIEINDFSVMILTTSHIWHTLHCETIKIVFCGARTKNMHCKTINTSHQIGQRGSYKDFSTTKE